MNMITELENIVKLYSHGTMDTLSANMIVNKVLDRIDELGFDVVEKKKMMMNK